MQVTITLQTANDYSNLIDAINIKIRILKKDMEEVKVCDKEETIKAWEKTSKELESLENIIQQLKTSL